MVSGKYQLKLQNTPSSGLGPAYIFYVRKWIKKFVDK